MAENEVERRVSPGVVIASLVLGLAAVVWCIVLQIHSGDADKKLAAAEQENTVLKSKLAATDAHLRAATETMERSLGVTQKQLELRASAIMARQEMDTQRLEKVQGETAKQIGQVSTEVSSVKTDVGGVKSDVAATRTDLESTKGQLKSVMGDAGVMSGLIARNHDELETLKHKGDRNYFEFTLRKGEQPVLLSTIKLQLKKVDTKRSKFNLVVSADDKNIEKKDKTLMEPVQFYSGKTPQLYEIVVNSLEKNTVSGYLSTPKAQ